MKSSSLLTEIQKIYFRKALNFFLFFRSQLFFQIDGSKLGFRDKMQLFAEQIGERTLKNRYKASTIQREIEQTIDDF